MTKREQFLPYGRQYIDFEDIYNVQSFLENQGQKFLTTGPTLKEFEDKIARYHDIKHGIAFSSATSALHGCCHILNLKEDDEVIVPAISFAASANCVRYCGAKVVFCDIDPDTLNIDPQEIKKLITSKTKAIIMVDMCGQPPNYQPIQKLCKEHNLVLIEDGAHTIGLTDPKIGHLADMTVFSFHPVKGMTTGEGGMVITDNDEWDTLLRRFRNHGIEQDYKAREKGNTYQYQITDLGYNYRMTDLQASLGLSQFEKLEWFMKKRQFIVSRYREEFNKSYWNGKLEMLKRERNSANHLFVVKIKNGLRDHVFQKMREDNIGVNVHYMPIYLHPYYKQLGYPEGLCPRSEEVYQEILSLPVHPGMSNQDFVDVIDSLKKIFNDLDNKTKSTNPFLD